MEGYDGNFDWLEWNGNNTGASCAIWYDDYGGQDWTPYDEYYAWLLLQNDPKLKIQNLSATDFQKWMKASALNLSAFKKITPAQVLFTKNRNMTNLQALLVKTGATTPVNLNWKPTPLNLEECADTNNGQGDTAGDGCDWYNDNPSSCGLHDTEWFTAGNMCCICGGGSTNQAACYNTNNGATDSGSDGCIWYETNGGSCGAYDTATFKAGDMCCGCNGGTHDSTAVCHDTNGTCARLWIIRHRSSFG